MGLINYFFFKVITSVLHPPLPLSSLLISFDKSLLISSDFNSEWCHEHFLFVLFSFLFGLLSLDGSTSIFKEVMGKNGHKRRKRWANNLHDKVNRLRGKMDTEQKLVRDRRGKASSISGERMITGVPVLHQKGQTSLNWKPEPQRDWRHIKSKIERI